MSIRDKRLGVQLIVAAAILLGCGAATLSGALTAHADPVARTLPAEFTEAEPARRQVTTVGMIMAEQP